MKTLIIPFVLFSQFSFSMETFSGKIKNAKGSMRKFNGESCHLNIEVFDDVKMDVELIIPYMSMATNVMAFTESGLVSNTSGDSLMYSLPARELFNKKETVFIHFNSYDFNLEQIVSAEALKNDTYSIYSFECVIER